MNKTLKKTILTLIILMNFGAAFAQNTLDDINGLMRTGNVTGMEKYFDNNVSLTIAGNPSTYSKSQAEMILKDFFAKNPPKDFDMEHSGGNNTTKYVIGTLTTGNGNYRTYYAIKLKDSRYIIIEIRFEK